MVSGTIFTFMVGVFFFFFGRTVVGGVGLYQGSTMSPYLTTEQQISKM